MTEYRHLSGASRRELLRRRLEQLEAQHFEASLNLRTAEAQRRADPRLVVEDGLGHWRDELQRLDIAIDVNARAMAELGLDADGP